MVKVRSKPSDDLQLVKEREVMLIFECSLKGPLCGEWNSRVDTPTVEAKATVREQGGTDEAMEIS